MIQVAICKTIRLYQKTISPDHGVFSFGSGACRFYPTCSEYCYQSVQKHGAFKGLLKGFRRIAKCHPWHPGGVDLP